MNTIAIYGLQAAMGAIGVAAGAAKLAGLPVMAEAFGLLGFGPSFLMLAGAVEVVAGLCLLMPRGGVIGAVLMASVVVGATGLTIGQVAGRLGDGVSSGAARTHQAVHPGGFEFGRRAAFDASRGIDI